MDTDPRPAAPHSNTPPLQQSIRFSGPPARLDVCLSRELPSFSRARLQQLIKSGHVRVNGRPRKPHYGVRANDVIEIDIPPPEPVGLEPQEMPLSILFEDRDLIVVNKPPGLVVHPAPGHPSHTLVNALLHHCRDLAGVGGELRPGIVHRLDKDTSGARVVAKNEQAMRNLAAQFKNRQVVKQYLALVWGRPEPASGTVRTPMGRSPHNRKKMSARPLSGRPAVTHYETLQQYSEASLLAIRIETGRTHQIRVHLAHLGHPVVGDRQYGRARKTTRPIEAPRQMLHAERLAFTHPRTGISLKFNAPLPEDMRSVLQTLA